MGASDAGKPAGWRLSGLAGQSTAARCSSDATLTDPKILARPNAFYSAMRSEDPVHLDPKLGMYLVSRYEDLQTVLRDPADVLGSRRVMRSSTRRALRRSSRRF